MPSATDHQTVLGRIAELATQAAGQPDVPDALKSILMEIADLAGGKAGDTPEPSDISPTDNQSL